jgi:cytochrome c-type biogenesis protein CcmH/NrfF
MTQLNQEGMHVLLIANLATAVALALPGGTPVSRTVLPQIQQIEAHNHQGEFGEIYLLIEQALKCNCGCNLDVHSCQYQMQCGTSPAWSERIRTELEDGRTPKAIKAGFVADFGPTVLMAPPAEGFNLLGYLLPGTAIIMAGMMVGLVIRGNANRREGLVRIQDVSPEEQARLEAELRGLEKEEDQGW